MTKVVEIKIKIILFINFFFFSELDYMFILYCIWLDLKS